MYPALSFPNNQYTNDVDSTTMPNTVGNNWNFFHICRRREKLDICCDELANTNGCFSIFQAIKSNLLTVVAQQMIVTQSYAIQGGIPHYK